MEQLREKPIEHKFQEARQRGGGDEYGIVYNWVKQGVISFKEFKRLIPYLKDN